MAKDTNMILRNQMIYQVFPRQYSKEGNFEGIRKDLKRIKELGTDILYLLPIHPIGEKNKKGSIGCPYSIQNYREIHKELGTVEDFKRLIDDTHKMGMKLIIDVVYNHTSRDSYLLKTHPEWFYKDKNGKFNNRVGEWWDVLDFDYTKSHDLWVYLIDTLKYYVSLGVDGFRCDVASMMPKEFWKEVRSELQKLNPDIILLAESIHLGFVRYIRNMGFEAMSDSECYESFDMLYDYDIADEYEKFLKGGQSVNVWLEALSNQDSRYPKNYIKVHHLDNHDQPRVCSFIKDPVKLINLTALSFFLKGTAFVYAGDEAMDEKLPSLFEIDLVDWSKLESSPLSKVMSKMSEIKKHSIFKDGAYQIILEDKEFAHIEYENDKERWIGLFNINNSNEIFEINLEDGHYKNLFNEEVVTIFGGMTKFFEDPIIIKINK